MAAGIVRHHCPWRYWDSATLIRVVLRGLGSLPDCSVRHCYSVKIPTCYTLNKLDTSSVGYTWFINPPSCLVSLSLAVLFLASLLSPARWVAISVALTLRRLSSSLRLDSLSSFCSGVSLTLRSLSRSLWRVSCFLWAENSSETVSSPYIDTWYTSRGVGKE